MEILTKGRTACKSQVFEFVECILVPSTVDLTVEVSEFRKKQILL